MTRPWTEVVLIVLVAVQFVMGDLDLNPDISNGTCYYYDGIEADPRYMPCGNAALGHRSCCESLDMCLSSSACYNAQYGVTYLAGCTDDSYDDSVCPRKMGFAAEDQQWAGLVYCNGTSNEWVACQEDTTLLTVTTPSPCWCPDQDSRTVAFTDSSVLANIMSLPPTLGQSVTWKDAAAYTSDHSMASALGYSPTSNTDTITSLSQSGSRASSESGTNVLLPPASTSQAGNSTASASVSTFTGIVATSSAQTGNSGIGTGAKAGIIAGSIMGAIILGGLCWLIHVCMRRRSQSREAEAEAPPPLRDSPILHMHQTIDPEMRSPAWSGHKSELPAEESVTSTSQAAGYESYHHRTSGISEVEASPAKLSPIRPAHDGGLKVPGRKGTFYEMAG